MPTVPGPPAPTQPAPTRPAPAQPVPAEPAGWRDPRRPPAERVEELLGLLTPAERIAMLHQHAPAVPRLGLAAFRTGTEALHGVAWLGEATVFPQAVGLGATWHPELLERVGAAVSVEVRAKHAQDPGVSLNVWAPVVNLLRDPRWGRNEEGYSEDPLLVARLATAYCRGLRGVDPDRVRTAPTLKHFLAYNNEDGREVTSSDVRPRVLHEYDLPPFTEPVLAGVVDAVMPSYNLVNGRPSHVGPLLETLLRPVGPHELLVVSDAEAVAQLVEPEHYAADHATGHAAALLAGVDSFTVFGTDTAAMAARITEALDRGLIDPRDVDRAVRRVLTVRLRTGEFDPDGGPYGTLGADGLHRPEHRALAREAAREQVVLLRNDADLLPLRAQDLRVAVVGPLADDLCEDWYSGTMPYRVTVADGLRAAAGAGSTVTVAEGLDRVALRARPGGTPVSVAAGDVPFLACRDDVGPDDVDPDDAAALFDIRDHGDGVTTLRSVATHRYVTVTDEDRSLVADQPRPGGWFVLQTFTLVALDGGGVAVRHLHTGAFVQVDAATGALHATGEDVRSATGFDLVVVRYGLADAVAAAAAADTAVVVVGNDPHINGRETQDRTTLALPPQQEALVHAVAAVRPRTVLVVMSSYPYALARAQQQVPAILWTSHAGQETGHALADVLLGRHAPTGRLAQTWYRADTDLPDILDYDVIAARRTYQYLATEPLYPFGHGLTYTTFRYGQARAVRGGAQGEDLAVTVEITNTGRRAATEVVQLYSRAVDPDPDRPRRRLQAFARVPLDPGETCEVTLAFPVAGLAHWDVAAHAMRVEPGAYELLVGRSCEAVRTSAVIEIPGARRPARPVLDRRVAAADFDARAGVRLVAAAPEPGDAVEVDGAGGQLLFRRADLGGGDLLLLQARVSRTEPGTARLDVRLDDPQDGPGLGGVDVPCTGDREAWTTVSCELHTPGFTAEDGVRDLYLVLTGAQRLEAIRLTRPTAGPATEP